MTGKNVAFVIDVRRCGAVAVRNVPVDLGNDFVIAFRNRCCSTKGVEVNVPTPRAVQVVIGNVTTAPASGTAILSIPVKTPGQAPKQVLSTSTTIVLAWKTISDVAYGRLTEQFKSIGSSRAQGRIRCFVEVLQGFRRRVGALGSHPSPSWV